MKVSTVFCAKSISAYLPFFLQGHYLRSFCNYANKWPVSVCCEYIYVVNLNRPFLSCPKLLFNTEGKCDDFDMI